MSAFVRGGIAAGSSWGKWIIRAQFYDGGGAYLGYQNADKGAAGTIDATWQEKGGQITTPAGAATIRIYLYNYMNSGWVAYDDVRLFPVNGSAATQRATYSLAGQAVAVRVTGDPEPTNNGLFYIHSDHLGSTSVY